MSGTTPPLELDRGVTASDGVDAFPVPALLVAVTVNVYAVPLEREVTTQVRAPVVAQVRPPGDAVTLYAVIAPPPSLSGALQ